MKSGRRGGDRGLKGDVEDKAMGEERKLAQELWASNRRRLPPQQ
jgi:hypothetical protein